MKRNFPQLLRELRQDKNLTQAQLAKELQYTQSNISEWEKGTVEPKESALIAIATYFNVSIDYLTGLEDDFGAKVAPMGTNSIDITAEERQLIEDFRKLNYYKQQLIKNNIKAMLPAETESEQKKRG
ncbi:MAG: helix-turn-helix domain-containing protein [Candidatus Coproplasma sp.]